MNSAFKFISFSPNFIKFYNPFLTVYFINNGSKIWSIVNSIFSNKYGYPYWIELSSSFVYLALFYDPIYRLLLANSFLIQLLAYPEGSIINGHFLEFYIIIAFSVEFYSIGRSNDCHSWI